MMEDEKKKLHKFITYISLTSDNERLNTAHTEKIKKVVNTVLKVLEKVAQIRNRKKIRVHVPLLFFSPREIG